MRRPARLQLWSCALHAIFGLSTACGTGESLTQRDAGPSDSVPDASLDGGEADGAVPDASTDPGLEPFDTSRIRIERVDDVVPCALSGDRRALAVGVVNDGSEPAPPLVVEVRTRGTEHRVRLETTELPAGARAELTFERGPMAGFRDHWEYEVAIDPDGLRGPTPPTQPGSCEDLRGRVGRAMTVLRGWYDQETGLWNRSEWWRGANMLEVTIDQARELGDPTYFDLIDNTFVKNENGTKHPDGWDISHGDFLNEFYDDEGWWALAWIKAYDLTHETKYLDMAKTIFAAMTTGWDENCGGGVYWRTPHEAKNAIPNELFLTIAARLHLRSPGDTAYLDWAEREWAWFKSTGMITAEHQILDGLNTACVPGGPAYTYNQGVILGGLVELWRANGDESLLDEAEAIASAALTRMTSADGVFLEALCDDGNMCDTNDDDDSDGCRCGDGDGVQFKGVFARNLAVLYEVRPRPAYQAFLIRQSDSLWNHARSADDKLGKNWQGSYDEKGDASRQSSAMDALIGAVRVAEPNLALGAVASGSASCTAAESPAQAIDGSSRLASKWCAGGAGGQNLTVDLGAVRYVTGFRVQHAGAGGEEMGWNTRDFTIEVSEDGQSFHAAVNVTGNVDSVTSHPIPAENVRHVRLNVVTAQTSPDFVAARIYELEVLGAGR